MLYPSSMFESGLPKASIVPVYIDNHSTGSTGTSKAHQGSPVDSDEIWNRTSHNEPFPTRLEIPSLPIQPTDIFHNFDIGRQKKRQKPNTDRISSPSPDSGYTTDSTAEAPNLWQRIVQDSEYHQRALFSWESLDPRCRQPDSIPENDADAIRRHSPKPPFLTEAGNAVFDAVYQSWLDHDWSYREHSLVVSEETLVEALLNAAVGIPSLFFQYNIRTSAFEAVNKERKIRVEGCGSKSLERLIDGFMTIGTHYCRLEYVCEVLVNNTGNHGITGVSFGTALKSYLLFLHQFARDLYEPHALPGTSGPPTKPRLLEIQQRLRIVGHVLEMLCRMCECSIWDARHSLGFHLPRGSGLLSVLYNAVSELEMMMPFGPKLAGDNVPRMVVRALFLTLLERSSQPYFSWLQKWLHNLDPITLTDPFGEFYIRFINPEEHEPDAAFTDGGRMFWTYEYQINPDHEPISFLDDDLKQLVYEAGKSSLILRRHCPGHPLFSVYEQCATSGGSIRPSRRIRDRDLGEQGDKGT
ncbi:Spc98 family-domain-containing protein [Polychytrium aggregatum]|uniref:Spc98 family-domain-containing protein n=1 Tax=Polychytrium aggregatum TaxID=110093 RepID=UPI0022FE222A|nr:Spc98 family-domain-containing protein [Polychytrium aggregatum]KAI9207919.1 Spc98 family-domain-containing protein [Polychytrium aggregatum]